MYDTIYELFETVYQPGAVGTDLFLQFIANSICTFVCLIPFIIPIVFFKLLFNRRSS